MAFKRAETASRSNGDSSTSSGLHTTTEHYLGGARSVGDQHHSGPCGHVDQHHCPGGWWSEPPGCVGCSGIGEMMICECFESFGQQNGWNFKHGKPENQENIDADDGSQVFFSNSNPCFCFSHMAGDGL